MTTNSESGVRRSFVTITSPVYPDARQPPDYAARERGRREVVTLGPNGLEADESGVGQRGEEIPSVRGRARAGRHAARERVPCLVPCRLGVLSRLPEQLSELAHRVGVGKGQLSLER